MTESTIQNDLRTYLSGDDLSCASTFVQYLLEKNLRFHRDTAPCWQDKRYYWVMDGEDCVCFIAIADPDEPDNRWTVWSDDMGDDALSEDVGTHIGTLAWQHVDYCGKCGSCGGGRHKVIFGRAFDDVCGCTFRVDNPTAEDLPFLFEIVRLCLHAR